MLRRSMSFIAALLLMASSMAVQGCGGSSEADVAGTYELDKAAVKAALEAEIKKQEEGGAEDPAAAMGAAFALGMIDSMNMTMTLNADKTASMQFNMMGQTDAATGTWSLEGEKITVTMAAEGEAPKSISGTVDGDTITLTPSPEEEEEMPFDMIFKKKA